MFGKPKQRFAVGHDVKQIQPAADRHVARLDDARDHRLARFGVSAQGFFLDGGQAAVGVARADAGVPVSGVVLRGLGHGLDDLLTERGIFGALRHPVLHADEFAGLLENAGGVLLDQEVERAAHGRIGGQAAGGVRSAADGADDQFVERHVHARRAFQLLQRLLDPGLAFGDGLARAAGALDLDEFRRAAGFADGFLQLALVEALAAQRHQQRARRRSGACTAAPSSCANTRSGKQPGNPIRCAPCSRIRIVRSRARRDARIRPGRRRRWCCGCPCGRRRGDRH